MRTDVAAFDAYGQLWLAVLTKAIEDATRCLPEPLPHFHTMKCPEGCQRVEYTEDHYYQRQARLWMTAERTSVGSLNWICSTLNISAEAVRCEYKRRLEDPRPATDLGAGDDGSGYPVGVLCDGEEEGVDDGE